MIQEYLKRMLGPFSLMKPSGESLSLQQGKVKALYKKFLQFYAEEVEVLEKEKFKNRLERRAGTERREIQLFKIVAELKEYDNQNIFIRFWWRITNRIQDVDEKRVWLASSICQHLTDSKDLFDFDQQQINHQELFPSRWKSILTQLKSAAIYFKSLLQSNTQSAVIKDDSDDKTMLNEEENESISPKNTSIVLVSNGSSDTLPDLEKTETDQLSLDQLYKLFYVCGFLNLPLEGVTPSQIKSNLNKLKLTVHPDKLPREYIDKEGNNCPYSEEAFKGYQEMMSTCFEIVQSAMPPLPKHIDSPLLPTELLSQLQIDEVYSSGKEQGQIFHSFLKFAKDEAEYNTKFQDFLLSVAQLENMMKNSIKNADKYINDADSYINSAGNYINNVAAYVEDMKQFIAETEQTTQKLNQIETEVNELKEKLHNDSTSKAEEKNDAMRSAELSTNSITEAVAERASNILIYKKLSEAACNNNTLPINTSLDESNETDSSAPSTNAQPAMPEQGETVTFNVLTENGEQSPHINDVSQEKHLTFQ